MNRLAGTVFLDWLRPKPRSRIDVRCGYGAFTALVCERCAPVEVQEIDLSEALLAFALTRAATRMDRRKRPCSASALRKSLHIVPLEQGPKSG